MPIPTDTFWNIRKLNWAFAISSIAMLGTFAWSILQDYRGHASARCSAGRCVGRGGEQGADSGGALTPPEQQKLDDYNASCWPS